VFPRLGTGSDHASFAGRFVIPSLLCCAHAPGECRTASDLIAKLNTVFVDVMQNAKSLGYEGRYKKLEPTLRRTYDFTEMARVTTGRYWRDSPTTRSAGDRGVQ